MVLSVVKTVTVLLGFVVLYLGWKAYHKTRATHLFWLVMGMGLMTLGAISEGIAFQGFGWSLDQSHVLESVVTLAGFAVLVYSLYA